MLRTTALVVMLAALFTADLNAQVCRILVSGLNRNRVVDGPVDTECPGQIHTVPFGNWGVVSNFGPKIDGHQFDGWCHLSTICETGGACRLECRDGWYEWNSCTSNPRFAAPNCTLYNAKDCTAQISSTDVNIHGTIQPKLPVRCPRDLDGDRIPDEGGCSDITFYDPGANFLSLYELDPLTGDQLVQTLHFPATPVTTECGAYGCSSSTSEWMDPIAWESPASPAKVSAQMAVTVHAGEFIDPLQACPIVAPEMLTTSAASYANSGAAPDSIVSSFGASLSEATEIATPTMPVYTLGGVWIEIIDGAGVQWVSRLLFTSPEQINWIIPDGLAPGEVSVSVLNAHLPREIRATERLRIVRVAPGLFSADSSGAGAAAGFALERLPDESELATPLFLCDGAGCTTNPVTFGDGDLYFVLFGTGIRGATSADEIRVTIDGEPVEITYVGPQPEYPGLDQINLRLPRNLAGRGVVAITLTVAGQSSNTVLAEIQ